MLKKIFISLFLFGSISGCTTYDIHTTKIFPPITREKPKLDTDRKFISKMSIDKSMQSASIGEYLFVVNRYIEQTDKTIIEVVSHLAPTDDQFPRTAKWQATHKFNDGNSGELNVYTTPLYYKGQIGVILDSNSVIATDRPVIQVLGRKAGRRWAMAGNGKFFKEIEKKTVDKINTEKIWGLRFGGMRSGFYLFEIINRDESTKVEVLQTIQVKENDFLFGFTVRDVFVKGKRKYQAGVIEYTAQDLQSVN